MTRAAAACLLAELESNRLTVALVPARFPRHETHCVRVAVERNPTWYQRLCAAFPSSRRRSRSLPDTRIRRASVLSILTQLAEGRPVRSRYVEPLRRIASQLSSGVKKQDLAGRSGLRRPASNFCEEGNPF